METHRSLTCRRRSSEFAGLGRRIDAWRSGCAGPQGRMPERLWREAVVLAQELGAESVSTELGLSRAALERRLGTCRPRGRAPARAVFLDVTPAPGPSPSSALEVETRDGTRLRLMGSFAELRALVLSVLGQAP